MKAVILAGGLGSRLSEETDLKPKPMVEIGGKPILWHIMKMYSAHGINDFVICLGYKGYMIKEYFNNYFLHTSDVTFDMKCNSKLIHHNHAEPWMVTLVDTGSDTMTGGRIKRVKKYIGDEDFCFTYGDGVSDVNIQEVIALYNKEKKYVTVTAVRQPSRFGVVEAEGNQVKSFTEKPRDEVGWISGGFFVLSPKVIDCIADDNTIWEREPMQQLAEQGEMGVYFHDGFWQPMDTLRERHLLEDLWRNGKAPWKVWD